MSLCATTLTTQQRSSAICVAITFYERVEEGGLVADERINETREHREQQVVVHL